MATKFVTQKSDGGIRKPDSLVEPLIGVYLGSRPGSFSPIHGIRDQEDKLHEVRGCTDLNNKLRGIQEGDTVLIQFEKYVPTTKGNPMVIMIVKKGLEDEETETYSPPVRPSVPTIDYDHPSVENEAEELPPPIPGNVLARFGIHR